MWYTERKQRGKSEISQVGTANKQKNVRKQVARVCRNESA